jgi:hypothetical protein
VPDGTLQYNPDGSLNATANLGLDFNWIGIQLQFQIGRLVWRYECVILLGALETLFVLASLDDAVQVEFQHRLLVQFSYSSMSGTAVADLGAQIRSYFG